MNTMQREYVARIAAKWVKEGAVYLDTETTGLDRGAEVCALALVDSAGVVLLDTLVKPTVPITLNATEVHGITNEMVADAPPFKDVYPQFVEAVAGRRVVMYNAAFDLRMIGHSLTAAKLEQAAILNADCAMLLYADFYGEWNTYRHSTRWQSLVAAARQCELEWIGTAHRALADAEMTRKIVLHMAATVEEKEKGLNDAALAAGGGEGGVK